MSHAAASLRMRGRLSRISKRMRSIACSIGLRSRRGEVGLRIGFEHRDQRRIAAAADQPLHEARAAGDVDQLVDLRQMREDEIDRQPRMAAGDRGDDARADRLAGLVGQRELERAARQRFVRGRAEQLVERRALDRAGRRLAPSRGARPRSLRRRCARSRRARSASASPGSRSGSLCQAANRRFASATTARVADLAERGDQRRAEQRVGRRLAVRAARSRAAAGAGRRRAITRAAIAACVAASPSKSS